MPYANPDAQRAYQLAWITRRRDEWIAENGPCQRCGSTEDLEVDHVDPATKSMNPTAIWGKSKLVRMRELAKCQVLCKRCHGEKTAAQFRIEHEHGTEGRYGKGCRCDGCRAAHTARGADYRARMRG